ncbi:DUF4382 domain-containing protein [Chloroflexota bacterium]
MKNKIIRNQKPSWRIHSLRAKTIAILAAVVLMVLAGCSESETPEAVTPDEESHVTASTAPGETGKLQIGVTDRPDKDVTSVLVTANLIEANLSQGKDEDGEWLTLIEEEVTFDLIAVAGIEEIIGNHEIPAGTYNQLRMHVTSVMVTLNGDEVQAEVPSGIVRVVRAVVVKADETTIATFDFNAEESVVVTGNDKVIFKPVVKLLVRRGDDPFEPATPPTEEIPTPPTPPTPELPPMFQSNADGSFFLEIVSPESSEVIVDIGSITISGNTTADAVVSVNDSFVEVDLEGAFETIIQLEDGVNLIEVVASLASGEQFDQVIAIIYSP